MPNLKSTVWIVPAADVAEMKRITESEEIGYKAGLGVPLSTTGANPPTHFGQHSWESRDPQDKAMLDFMQGKNQRKLKGRTRTSVKTATDRTIVGVDYPSGLTNKPHFDAVIAAAGLKIIEPKI